MSVDMNNSGGGNASGLGGWFESHPSITLGIFVLVALVVGGAIINKNTGGSASGTNSNLSGLQTDSNGNRLVYVPTSSDFITYNNNSNNDTTTTTSTSTTTTTVNPPLVGKPITPVVPKPAPPIAKKPNPAPTHSQPKYGLVWGAVHPVVPGDTLAYIASQSTMIMHTQQHAPTSVHITASDILAHNRGLTANLKVGQKVYLPSWERIS